MVSIDENIYIQGGRGETRSSNEIYRYNIGTQMYTWESKGVSALLAPKPSSYHSCFVHDGKLINVLGITDELGNPRDVHIWIFEIKQWKIMITDIDSRSRAVAG